jgi:hypothetical protein
LFSSEKQEKEYIGMQEGERLKTRLMYFDLIQLSKGHAVGIEALRTQ